jgi:hypothetical protein
MKKAVWTTMATAALLALAVPVMAQQTANATVNVTAHVNAKAKLTLDTNAVDFADADPDTDPVLSAAAINITVKARTAKNGSVTLTVVSDQDLTSGSDTIGINNLTWTAGGSGFVAGTMDKVTAASLGSWTDSGNHGGTQTLNLANSWSYATGDYTATLTYTLTAP